jgi:lipopolysaccharide export system protein LptA
MVSAQGTQLSFGGLGQDTSAPIEINSDELAISQTDSSATFSGNVTISQGNMMLSAPLVTVVYNPDTSDIAKLLASGGVTLVSGEEAAEADEAEYSVSTGMIEMRGNVLLAQGQITLAAADMLVNLNDGTALLSGRVRTILRPRDSNE